MMKLIGGSRIKGITKKRYITKNGIIEIETDNQGNEIIKRFRVKS